MELRNIALKEATKNGASYADIRIGEIFDENLMVKKGVPEEVNVLQSRGFGVRVIIKGGWGFASSVELTKKEVKEVTRRAVKIATASSK
ncbi:MAG: TldD/PmbA family protein, partial [Candidatus Bathyarchaeota archaeon]|nr:TldD/PmbA family protein [Candidatus Bathyarchaeota archaeon]